MDRLSNMGERLQRERDLTYRDQLQKIQYEINLVQRFDPYDPNVLETIADLSNEQRQTQGPTVHADGARSLMEMAGVRFGDYIADVEDLVEIRDYQLTQSKVRCQPPSFPPFPVRFTDVAVSYRTNTTEKSRNTRTRTLTKSKRPSARTVP